MIHYGPPEPASPNCQCRHSKADHTPRKPGSFDLCQASGCFCIEYRQPTPAAPPPDTWEPMPPEPEREQPDKTTRRIAYQRAPAWAIEAGWENPDQSNTT